MRCRRVGYFLLLSKQGCGSSVRSLETAVNSESFDQLKMVGYERAKIEDNDQDGKDNEDNEGNEDNGDNKIDKETHWYICVVSHHQENFDPQGPVLSTWYPVSCIQGFVCYVLYTWYCYFVPLFPFLSVCQTSCVW